MSVAALHAVPSSPHVGRIEFGPTRRARGSWAGSVTVECDGEVYGIDLDMIDVYLTDMVGFFEGVARPGWVGTTRWQSEFAELTMEAEAAPGQLVKLDFTACWNNGDELDNERQGQLLVRQDELREFAAQLRQLTGLRGPAERLHGRS